MIRQRDFSSLRPLIFVICVLYLVVTIGTIALTFTLNVSGRVAGGAFECAGNSHEMHCGKIGASTVIQVLVWIECLLNIPIIIICMLTLWGKATVERLPGNTAIAIPCSLILMFVMQIVFIIICLAKGYFRHHWLIDLALFIQCAFALPVAYLMFNLPHINGDSDPPRLRDDRQNLLRNASARNGDSSKRAAPIAKAPAPTSAPASGSGTSAEQQPLSGGTGTGTCSREELSGGSVTGSREPMPSGETIPVAPTSDPSGTTSRKDQSAKPPGSSKPTTPQCEVPAPPARELEDSESKKKKANQEAADLSKSNASVSKTKSASDRLKHTKIVIPPKSRSNKSSRTGAA